MFIIPYRPVLLPDPPKDATLDVQLYAQYLNRAIDQIVRGIYLDLQPLATTTGLTFGDLQSLATGDTVSVDDTFLPVEGSGGAVTLTSNPQVELTDTLRIIYIKGTSNTKTLTLVQGNGLKLQAATRTLGVNDMLGLYSDPVSGVWHELSWSNLP